MTLAVILFVSISSVSWIPSHMPLLWQSASAQDKSAPTAQDQTNQTSTQTAPDQSKSSPSTPPAKAAPSKKPASVNRRRHKQANLDPNCNPKPNAGSAFTETQAAPSNKQTSNSGSTSGTPTNTTAPNAPAPATSPAASNCPPSKVVIRQGGTTDPSIQLVGGGATGAQASTERESATQLLQSTQENLKRAEGIQLDPNQQEVVSQIHQFVDQSKAASTAGDLDRARTLAWKAQLLSEELVKPQK